MKVEKSARRIEITLPYGDALQPKVKARGYKWEPTKKVWWKGYTDEEMTWAQAQAEGKQEAAARFAERRANAVKLDGTYKQTEPVKEDLKALGCFLDSTGERVYSQSKGEYVFAKMWYAPKDRADRAKAIIQHGGAAKADAAEAKAAEAKAKKDTINCRVRDILAADGVPDDLASHVTIGAWSADCRFGWATVYLPFDVNNPTPEHAAHVGKCVLHDTKDDSMVLAPSKAAAMAILQQRLQSEQMPAATAEAATHGRVATGIRRSLQWRGSVAAKVGDVIHTKTLGWALVVAISAERVSARDIEEREDRDDFSVRQTPGVETNAVVIPVEATAEEIMKQAEAEAVKKIRDQAKYVRADAADDYRGYESEAYRLALENERRLDAGEKAIEILKNQS